MTEVVLGIDVGSSGVRIAARGRSGQLCGLAKIGMPPDGLNNPDVWWQAITHCLNLLDLSGLQVLALAIDGTSGSILAIDAEGNPLGLASMYHEQAGQDFVARVLDVAPQDTAALGGSSPLARGLAMQQGAARIIHQADWLMGQFCGQYDVSDENNALKTGYDPVAQGWPQWISACGFDMGLLPRVVPAGRLVGCITPAQAAVFKLPKNVSIVAGTTDGCAAFLASGATQPGDGVTSLGTTLTLKILSDRPVFAPQYGVYSHRIGEWWLAGGASNVGGGVLHDYFSADDMARLTPLLDPHVATGLNYYPLRKAGERFPIADPDLAPRLSPRPGSDLAFFQGILEGIADVEALGYQRLGELGASPLSSICSVGGGAANGAWTKMRLQKLQVPEKRPASDEAAMGTARLAWRGIGHAD